ARAHASLNPERNEKDRRGKNERPGLAGKAGGYTMLRQMLRCRLAIVNTRRSKQKAEARARLEQIAANPDLRKTLSVFLAENFAAIGEHERALEFVRRARREDPENWEVITLETQIHHAAGRHRDAVNSAVETL